MFFVAALIGHYTLSEAIFVAQEAAAIIMGFGRGKCICSACALMYSKSKVPLWEYWPQCISVHFFSWKSDFCIIFFFRRLCVQWNGYEFLCGNHIYS